MNKNFELIRLYGKPVLFSRNRVSDRHLPKSIFHYELSRASGDDLMTVHLEPHAREGYCGTIISKFPLNNPIFHSDRDMEDECRLSSVGDYLAESIEPVAIPKGKIRVLIIEPLKRPRTAIIPNTIRALQQIVGGPIETVSPFDDSAIIVCNEIGKLIGLHANREINNDILVGTFLICGVDYNSDGFVSLTDEQIEHYSERFNAIEYFARFERS